MPSRRLSMRSGSASLTRRCAGSFPKLVWTLRLEPSKRCSAFMITLSRYAITMSKRREGMIARRLQERYLASSCDIAPCVRKGENEIRVEVTSTWFNRLAYDFNQPPERRKTWTVWNIPRMTPPCLKSDAELRDSGLIGPVKLLKERNDNP